MARTASERRPEVRVRCHRGCVHVIVPLLDEVTDASMIDRRKKSVALLRVQALSEALKNLRPGLTRLVTCQDGLRVLSIDTRGTPRI